MSTTLVAALIAIAGVVAVAGVSWVFYLIGRAEDRERAEADREAAGTPPPPRHEDHPERNGRLARERRRPLPPRRPL